MESDTQSLNTIARPIWDLDTPALLVDLDILDRNIARMASVFRDAGVRWRPHTKGLKIPALAHKLLTAGAQGITCAKLGEAEVMAAGGIADILVANQVVGKHKIARLVNLLHHARITVAVDDIENARAISQAAGLVGVTAPVVIEVDLGMARAGVTAGRAVLDLARQLVDCPGLEFVGVMGWEGHAAKIDDPVEKRRQVVTAVEGLTKSADICRQAGIDVDVVSCGGSGTYYITAYLPGVTEVQAGGGVFCDISYRHQMHVEHEYALTVLATVTSRPSSDRIICDAGKKAMSSDAAVPEPVGLSGVSSVNLSAEHARIVLTSPNSDLRVGDKLEFVVGYSDTTMCLHDELYGIRNNCVEIVWPVLGRGKFR